MEEKDIQEDFNNFISKVNSPDDVVTQNDEITQVNGDLIENELKPEDVIINPQFIHTQETPSEESKTEINTDVYSMTLEFIKQNNLLHGIPDDLTQITEESFNELIQKDAEIRNMQALEYVKSRAGDDFVADLFDIVYNGGTIDDVKYVKDNIIENQKNLLSYDLENKNHRKALIELYLKEGLDPKIPSNKLQLERLNNTVQSIFEELKDKALAEEAQQYFYNKFETLKQEEKQRLINIEEEKRKQMYYEIEKEKQWTSTFIKDLESSKLESSKKDEIRNQFAEVELSNGDKMPLWKFKMDTIWENPNLTIKLMDFLTSFDEYKLEFKNKSSSVKEEFTSKLQKLIADKGINKTSGTSIPNTKTNNKNNGIF